MLECRHTPLLKKLMIYPVDNLDDAYNACHPDKPLENIEDTRYLDLSGVRSPHSISKLTTRIVRAQADDNFHKQLFSGHRGSGKSTELYRLKGELTGKGYAVIFLDVAELIDLAEITYQDVLLIIATGIVKELEKEELTLDETLLNDLQMWFADRVMSKVYSEDKSFKVAAKAEAKFKIPFLEMLTNLQGEVRSASGRRIEVRKTLEKELRVFIAKLNDLIIAARLKLQSKDFVDLVIIVDGLEKMSYKELDQGESSHSHLFIRHAEQLNAPQAHVIYTMPIALAFNSNVGNEFTAGVFTMPMIKYQHKPDEENKGEAKLIELVSQRMNLNLFEGENDDLLKQLIAMSGGSMRDLFRLIRFSTETMNDTIKQSDVTSAIQTLAKEFDRLVHDDFIELLQKVKDSKNLPVDGDKLYEQLLDFRLVHEYENGERWADIHSILTQIKRLNFTP